MSSWRYAVAVGKQSRRKSKRQRKPPGASEAGRRAKQRAAARPAGGTPQILPAPLAKTAEEAAESREEALHVDARDWREVKIQRREQEIVDAVERGDTATARQILDEVRANAGGCDICSVKPAEGEGYVLSTTVGRNERRWGHRDCLLETADRWVQTGREPVWTPATGIFTSPGEDSTKHAAGGA